MSAMRFGQGEKTRFGLHSKESALAEMRFVLFALPCGSPSVLICGGHQQRSRGTAGIATSKLHYDLYVDGGGVAGGSRGGRIGVYEKSGER
ncbi:hypothetical protein U1Q18_042184 [Sarracenia purpurea var. burkii]